MIGRDDRLSDWLYPRVLARARELGTRDAEICQGIYRADPRTRAIADAHGFRAATVFHRMRVDHGRLVEPVAPPGVSLRVGPGDEDFRRTAHTVLIESFKDHFGWVPDSFERWHERLEIDSTFDWTMLTVAELDSRPV